MIEGGYKARLASSQEKALLRIIGTKIDRDMRALRSIAETSPSARRRWIWELLQNGKDAHQGQGVRFLIETPRDKDELIFKHTGKPFTAEDIRFLIEQISTKERSKNEGGVRDSTGQFGTGFLSTHILSESVMVRGVAKEPGLDYKQFHFVLDRGGLDLAEIEASVEAARVEMATIDLLPSLTNYDSEVFHTSFGYSLSDGLSKRAALEGIEDLDYCLPYTLIYAPAILEVQLPNEDKYFRQPKKYSLPDTTFPVHVSRVTDCSNNTIREYAVVSNSRELTTVSIPIRHIDQRIYIDPIPVLTPRLFCDFPLVGSEAFGFPAIINNPNFEPTDARDGVFLTESHSRTNPNAELNKHIIGVAIELFLELAEHAARNDWGNLYNLVSFKPMTNSTGWIQSSWHLENVVNPLREALMQLPIVRAQGLQKRLPLITTSLKEKILFPMGRSKEVRKELWLLLSQLNCAASPLEEEIEIWSSIVWDDCELLDIDRLSAWLQRRETVDELRKFLVHEEADDWLRRYYSVIASVDEAYIAVSSKFRVFPDQNGRFRTAGELYQEKGEIPEIFKDILFLLESDIRADLASKVVPSQVGHERTRDIKFAAERIDTLVNEKSNDRRNLGKYREPFRKLLSWFGKNPTESQSLFPSVYSRKHLLYDDEHIAENLAKADELDALMCSVGVASVEELRSLLTKEHHSYLPSTEEALVSMGITNQEEWEAALKDKNLAELFAHKPIPTTEMFLLAQSMIESSRTRVLGHLRTMKQYDVTNAELLAPTVLGGILKDGIDIKIVVRPAWNGEVIVYYSAEQDVLDFDEHAELWADTGSSQQKITLGHILKKSEIRKFRI